MVKTLLLCGVYLSLSLVWAVPCNGSGEGRADPTTRPVVSASPRLDRPQVFAPGIISTEDDEAGGVFNPDQTEFYFAKFNPYTTYPRIGLLCVSRWRNHQWSTPEVLPFSGQWLDFPPRLSTDGKTLFFASSRPVEGSRSRVLRIWSVARRGDTWGGPVVLPAPINLETCWNWGPSVDRQGTMYFASTRDGLGRPRICRSRLANGQYGPVEVLGPEINLDSNQSDPFISPDGKSLHFASSGDGGSGDPRPTETLSTGGFPYPRGDLYVSFEHNGKWTRARHLGSGVNTFADESHPALSPDGKLLFFTTERSRFTVPAERRLDMNELEGALHSLENGHGNISFIAVDALQREVRP